MPVRLDSSTPGFEAGFAQLLAAKREVSANVDTAAAAIIQRVRSEGDAALFALSAEHDKIDLQRVGLRVTPNEIATAVAGIDKDTRAALE